MTARKELNKLVTFAWAFGIIAAGAFFIYAHARSEGLRKERIEHIKQLEEQVDHYERYARKAHDKLEQCREKGEVADAICRLDASNTITEFSYLLYSCYTQRDVWDICQYECVRIECLMEAGERGEFDTEEE